MIAIISKIILFFVGLIIALFSYRIFYFSKDKKFLVFSIAFFIFSLTYVVKLFGFSASSMIFVFKTPLYVFLTKLLFLIFVFLLIISLLSPKNMLEWSLMFYIGFFTFALSFFNNIIFLVSIAFLILLVSMYLFKFYFASTNKYNFLTATGMFILAISVAFQIFDPKYNELFEVFAALIFFVYVIMILLEHNVSKKQNKKTSGRKQHINKKEK